MASTDPSDPIRCLPELYTIFHLHAATVFPLEAILTHISSTLFPAFL